MKHLKAHIRNINFNKSNNFYFLATFFYAYNEMLRYIYQKYSDS